MMKDRYDFAEGVKNPYAEKLKQGYTVTVHYDFSDEASQSKDNCNDAPTGAPPSQKKA